MPLSEWTRHTRPFQATIILAEQCWGGGDGGVTKGAREMGRERVALSDVRRAESGELGWEKGGRGDKVRDDPRRGLVIGQKAGRDWGGDEQQQRSVEEAMPRKS